MNRPLKAQSLDKVVLVAITDFDRFGEAVTLERAARLCRLAAPGTVGVQLRDRTRSSRDLLALGEALAKATQDHGQRFIVNDRLDLALALTADAVHLGEASVAVEDARALSSEWYVFRAIHDVARVLEGQADAVVVSPIVEPRKGTPALGFPALQDAREHLRQHQSERRLFALGGVSAETAAECLDAGAHGVAAIGAAFGVDDPTSLLRSLRIARA